MFEDGIGEMQEKGELAFLTENLRSETRGHPR